MKYLFEIITVVLLAILLFVSIRGMREAYEAPDIVSYIETLEKYCPVGYPVTVAFYALEDSWGETVWIPETESFQIILDTSIRTNEAALEDLIAHEWAHVMTWDMAMEDDHGPLWGMAFAKAYRTLANPW